MASQAPAPSRALILAGGGLKVAFQAGVLQVWLDEAGLRFDLADGASGGCFNLAMYAQGLSGRQIADNWRGFRPLVGIEPNLPQLARLAFARSLFSFDAYRQHVFPAWGLDWDKIRQSERQVTFNYYNFSRYRLETLEPHAMDEDRLVACVSLPMWFPPVVIDGDTCIDSVYNTDANIEEAIRRGADELWIIWTVGQTGVWSDGFINNYFQIIEVAANGRLRDILARIERSNAALGAGGHGEFGRPIVVKMLSAEVDLNYIIDLDADRFAEAVNAGVDAARAWCTQADIPFNPLPDAPVPAGAPVVGLWFREVMKGFLTRGDPDPMSGAVRGEADGLAATLTLAIDIDDVARFVTEPHHEASVTGTIAWPILGGERPIERGRFNLLVDTEDPTYKLMTYRLVFTDAAGERMTLVGYKDVRSGEHHDAWTTTTTLFTRILKGAVQAGHDDTAEILAAGIVRVHMLDFVRELENFKVSGGAVSDRIRALARFGALFLGKLWDVYASRVMPVSPV